MNLWKIFLLFACLVAVNCKPEKLEDVAKEESEDELVEKQDKMLSNGEEAKTGESEAKDEDDVEMKFDDDFKKDELKDFEEENKNGMMKDEKLTSSNEEHEEEKEEDEHEEEEQDEHEEEKQDEKQGGKNLQEKKETAVKNEDEEQMKDTGDKKKKDEKFAHNDPQVGYTLRRNFIHDALETWSPAYSVSFNIKLLYKTNIWTNILHMTTGGNSGFGRRIPAVFIAPHSTRLYVCNAFNSNSNYCVSKVIPLHKYIYVSISQYPTNTGKYMYRVYVYNQQLINAQNHNPRYFQNVKIYKADPWHHVTPANIRYLNINNNQYAGHPIRKHTLIKHFPTYFSEFEVSFRIRPYGKINAWTSILHVTKGGDNSGHGDRIPGVWFRPNTNKLLISTSRNNNKNYYWTSPELPTNKDTIVNIKQKVIGCCSHYYTITIDNSVKLHVLNSSPRTFHNVRVYQGDPWSAAAKAYIRKVEVKTTSGGGYKLVKSRILRHIPRIEKQWYLSFDVKHVGPVKNYWTNILHATIGGNIGTIGFRIPGIWFRPNTRRLHICNSIANTNNYCYDTPNIPFNKYTNIQVTQIYETDNKRYRYVILVNNVVKLSVYNNIPRVFHDVRLWGADPWYPAANAYIKNLVFKNIYHKK